MSEIYELYLEDSWNDVRLIKYCSSMLEDPSRVHLRSLRIPTGFNPGEKASVLLAEVVGWAPLESLSLDCSDSFFKSCPELAYALASSLGIRYLHLGLSSAGYMTLRWLSQMESQPREIKLSNLEIHNQLSYWQLLQPFIDSLQVLRVEGFDRFDTGNGLVWPRVCILEVGCMADFSQLSRAFPAVQDLVVIDTKVGLDFNCDIPLHTEWANLDCIAYWTRTAVVPLQCHTRLLDLHEWRLIPPVMYCIQLCSPIVLSCRMNSRANECYADLTQLAQAAPLMQYLNIFFDHTDAESLECVVCWTHPYSSSHSMTRLLLLRRWGSCTCSMAWRSPE
ncbi:hypothetical protein BKA93DRAFT_365941 [Sparassis latifolia]